MSNKSNRSFSPFLKTKNYLSYMRFCLGFPLAPLNDTSGLFEFKIVREVIRHLLYVVIVVGAATCTGVIYYTSRRDGDPSSTFNKELKTFGFTGLDVAVINILPFLNIASNTVYFLSFKTNVFRINKISSLLVSLNEDLHKILGNDLFESLEEKKRAKGLKRYWNLISISVTPLVAAALLTGSFATIAFGDNAFEFSNLQKIVFCVSLGVFDFCYIYPATAASADYLVCFLLCEAKEMCEKYCTAMHLLNKPDKFHSGLHRSHQRKTIQ